MVSHEKIRSIAPKPLTRNVIKGRKPETADLKYVPRRLTAFVGRLHIETTEDDLLKYLEHAKIINPICRKLVSKDGRVFKTAAFMVSCDSVSKDAFHDEETWPVGCELRDWVFYQRPSN